MRHTLIITAILSSLVISVITLIHIDREYGVNPYTISLNAISYIQQQTEKKQASEVAEQVIEEKELEILENNKDRNHYTLRTVLHQDQALLDSHLTLRMQLPEQDYLALDNYAPSSMGNMTVSDVLIFGEVVAYEFVNNRITVPISGKYRLFMEEHQIEQLVVDVLFKTRVPRMGTRFGVKDNIWLLTTWYPILAVKDDQQQWINRPSPVGFGDPFYFEHADYDVYLIADKKINWVTSGQEVSMRQIDSKNVQYHWQERMIRNFALVGSKDYIVHEHQLDENTIVQVALTSTQRLADIKKMLDYAYPLFKNSFGELPYNSLALAETSYNTNYALEYPNIAIWSKDLYERGNFERWLVHEVAHIWWYNAVGNHEVDSGWIDEGLAEQAVVLYMEYRYGEQVAKEMRDVIRRHSTNLINNRPNMVMGNSLHDFRNRTDFFNSWYYRSADMYLTLRDLIGNTKYNMFLKNLYEPNVGKIISIEDLEKALQQTINGRSDYFDNWVNQAYSKTKFVLDVEPLAIMLNDHMIDSRDIGYDDWQLYIDYQLMLDILFAGDQTVLTLDYATRTLQFRDRLPFAQQALLLEGQWMVPIDVLKMLSEHDYRYNYQQNVLVIYIDDL